LICPLRAKHGLASRRLCDVSNLLEALYAKLLKPDAEAARGLLCRQPMPIRIDTIAEPERTVIKIDGHLKREDMGELVRILCQLNGPAALDLAELQSVDREALVQLRDFIDSGLEWQAASPYVELLLKSGAGQSRCVDENSA
jgi:hypothetical protein